MHLTPKGFVPGRHREPLIPLSLHKILEYRGKMPLPPIILKIDESNDADY